MSLWGDLDSSLATHIEPLPLRSLDALVQDPLSDTLLDFDVMAAYDHLLHSSSTGEAGLEGEGAEAALALQKTPTVTTSAAHGDTEPVSETRQRYLDPDTCGGGCSSCTPAPEVHDEHLYVLLGECGKKNGEKRLRRLLTRTREWKDQRSRQAIAAEADALGHSYAPLGAVMRAEANCSVLRKSHLLHLARSWGYQSCLWQLRRSNAKEDGAPKGEPVGAQAARHAGRASSELALQTYAVQRPLSAWQDVRALHDFCQLTLRPIGMDAATKFGGPAALHALEQARGGRFVTRHLVEELTFAARSTADLAATVHAIASDMSQRHVRATSGSWSSVVHDPAWRALAGSELDCERIVRVILHSLSQGAVFSRNRASLALRASGPDAPESLDPTEVVWLDEMYAGQNASLEFMQRSTACLQDLKLSPLPEYLAGAVLVMDMLECLCQQSGRQMAQRAERMATFLPATEEADSGQRPPLYRFFGRT